MQQVAPSQSFPLLIVHAAVIGLGGTDLPLLGAPEAGKHTVSSPAVVRGVQASAHRCRDFEHQARTGSCTEPWHFAMHTPRLVGGSTPKHTGPASQSPSRLTPLPSTAAIRSKSLGSAQDVGGRKLSGSTHAIFHPASGTVRV